jgi:hypothetical protein
VLLEVFLVDTFQINKENEELKRLISENEQILLLALAKRKSPFGPEEAENLVSRFKVAVLEYLQDKNLSEEKWKKLQSL